MKDFVLEISEHALLRWIERVYKLDLAEIRAEIHAAVYEAARAGATRVSTRGVTACIQINTATGKPIVATILPTLSPGMVMNGQAQAKGYQKKRRGDPSRQEHGRQQRRRARGLVD